MTEKESEVAWLGKSSYTIVVKLLTRSRLKAQLEEGAASTLTHGGHWQDSVP
jgi:hypothetical protein